MGKKITKDAAANPAQKIQKEREDKVVLQKLTSIALKMREIRRKATQPKSSELN